MPAADKAAFTLNLTSFISLSTVNPSFLNNTTLSAKSVFVILRIATAAVSLTKRSGSDSAIGLQAKFSTA